MTDDQDLTAYKRRVLTETRADLLRRNLSNSENYDKAILSLSTVFLGFSFAFLKDFVPFDQAQSLWLLYCSWISLTVSVVTTIVSFCVSQIAIDKQIEKAENYYLSDIEEALTRSWAAKANDWINYASGLFFVLGVLLTTAFVITNFERSSRMSDKSKSIQQANESVSVPKLQKIDRSAPIPNLQRVPQSTPNQSSSSGASNQPASGGSESSSEGGKK